MQKNFFILFFFFFLVFGCTSKSKINNTVSSCDGSDIATARIAAMTGTINEIYLEKTYPQAQLLLFDDINDAFLAVRSGKADYTFASFPTSLLAVKNSHDLVMLPITFFSESIAIAINKKDTILLHQINELITIYKNEALLDDIIARWLKEDGSDYEPFVIKEVSEGKTLRVGITANREPMCFVANGKTTGLDIELIERIAYDLRFKLKYFDMKFSSLIAAIETGKVDIVISNICITEERLKHVNFSEPYYSNPQVMTALAVTQTNNQSWFSRMKESFTNNLLVEKRYLLIWWGLQKTMIITFFSIVFGTFVGALICYLRMSRSKTMVTVAKVYINVMRGMPILVLLMFFFYVIFASSVLSATIVAIITFSFNMGAYSSEIFRTAIQAVDKGQTEAGIALGFSKIQTFIYVVFPQALRNIIPVYKGEVISLLKMTSIVGYIAVVDLTKATDMIRARTFDAFFPLMVVAIIYFLLAWLLGFALDRFHQKITSSK